jgi:hypothetical protein
MDMQPVSVENELERAISIRAKSLSGCDAIAKALASLENHLVQAPSEQRTLASAVEEELERAIFDLRARFLRGCDAIAKALASLENHLVQAPIDERESVRVVATQIAITQECLKAQLNHLPAPTWERFKAIVSVLKAQQAPLEHLSALIERHVLPRQLQNLSVTRVRTAQASTYEPVQNEHASALRHARLIHGEEPVSSDAHASRGQGPHAGDPTSRWLLSKVRKQAEAIFKTSAAMIVASVLLSPFVALLGSKLRDLTATPSAVSNVTAGSELPPTPPPAPATKLRGVTATPSAVSNATAALEPPPNPPSAPATIPQMDAQGVSLSASNSSVERTRLLSEVTVGTGRPGPATALPDQNHAAPRTVSTGSTPNERFVPVVFTHKDHATASRALTDLQQQHPKLLIHRQGEIQPVDLGKKGIWYRLVFLPAGPRLEATKLCDRLMAEGYDRCWVKPY